MPIVGLMPQNENVFAGLPRIAKLRKGAPKEQRTRKDGSTYEVVGKDLDYLRPVFDPEYEHLKSKFTALYGKNPNNMTAFLNADSVVEAFDFWKEEWTATTMLTRCDGMNKHVWFNQKNGRYQTSKVLCDVKCGCKAVGRLNLILPDFTMETGVLGYFTIETHSEEDIRTLYARITSIWATFGKLRGVPLVMYRVPRKLSVPEIGQDKERTGKRMNKTMHMLDIRVSPEYTKQHLLAAITSERGQLPAPPVSSLPVSTQRAITVLNPDRSRIGALPASIETNGNGNGHSDEPEEKEPDAPKPPAWLTHANRATLANRAKSEKLMKTGDFIDFVKLAGYEDEAGCCTFDTGASFYDHAKSLIEAKKIVQTPAGLATIEPEAPKQQSMPLPVTIKPPPVISPFDTSKLAVETPEVKDTASRINAELDEEFDRAMERNP